MKCKFFAKNHWNTKSYTFMAFFITIGLFNSTAQAMDPDVKRTTAPIHSPVDKLKQDLDIKHNKARENKARWTKSACGSFYMQDGHYVAEIDPNYPKYLEPLSWHHCTKCTDERDSTMKYITPLVQEDKEKTPATIKLSPFDKLEQDLDIKHNKARENKAKWTKSACGSFYMEGGHYVAEIDLNYPQYPDLLSWKHCTKCTDERDSTMKYLRPLVQENEKLNLTNALLEKKVEDLEAEIKVIYEKTSKIEIQ